MLRLTMVLAALAGASAAGETMIAPVHAHSPSIAWQSDRHGILFMRDGASLDSMFLLVDRTGNALVGSEIKLAMPVTSYEPTLSVTASVWIGAWRGSGPGSGEAYFATFDESGSFTVPPTNVSNFNSCCLGGVRLVSTPTLHWLTWAENYPVCCDGVSRAAIDDTGTIVVPPAPLVQAFGGNSWPAWDDGTSRLGIVWQTNGTSVEEWHSANIDASGALTGTEVLVSPARRDREGRLEANGGGFGFGCQSTDFVNYDLYFTPLDADMDPLAPPIPITTGGSYVPGNLVWTGVAYVWPVQYGEFGFYRLTRAGDLLGTRRRLSTGARPSPYKTWPEAAMADTVVGVVWTDERLGVGQPSIWYQHVPLMELLVGGGAGAANAAQVKSRSSYQGEPVLDFAPYAGGYGANVASGGIDGTPLHEILTGPGPGASYGPQVRGFTGGEEAIAKVNFYAYATLRYGTHVASTDLEDDGIEEILTGPGPGSVFGPHVRGFDYDGASVRALQKVSFYAYFSLRYGAEVAGGDVDADGFGEIVTGPGPSPSFGAHLRGFDYDGTSVSAIGGINAFVFPSTYGLVVGAGDLTGDGREELLAAAGPSAAAGSEVRVYGYSGTLAMVASATPWAYTGGAHVAAGDMDLAAGEELAVTPGFLPANPGRAKLYRWTGTGLQDLPTWDQDVYPGAGYGATCAIGNVGI